MNCVAFTNTFKRLESNWNSGKWSCVLRQIQIKMWTSAEYIWLGTFSSDIKQQLCAVWMLIRLSVFSPRDFIAALANFVAPFETVLMKLFLSLVCNLMLFTFLEAQIFQIVTARWCSFNGFIIFLIDIAVLDVLTEDFFRLLIIINTFRNFDYESLKKTLQVYVGCRV